MASFIADDLTYHDDQVPGVGLSSWDYPCPLNEGFRVCVCVRVKSRALLLITAPIYWQ
jgi:hypothetical protein